MNKIILAYPTPAQWTRTVLADFDAFLLDHAAAEKKVSGMAISMLSHHPVRVERAAAVIAIEANIVAGLPFRAALH